MGAIFSYFKWWEYGTDEPDPVTGLTRKDRNNIHKSWSLAYQDPIGTGGELLVRYFTQYPETRKFFRTFQDMDNKELRSNSQFQAHCLNIMTWFNTAIQNLEKPELIKAMSEKLGQNHNRRKVSEQNFLDIKNVLVQLLIDALQIDEETQTSWGKLLTFLYKEIFHQLQ